MLKPSSYLSNVSFLVTGRGVKMVINFVTIAIVARYLGTELFGQLVYAAGFASLFCGLAALGVDNILAQELAAYPDDRPRRLGAAWTLKMIGALGCIVVTSVCALLFEPNVETQCMIILLSACAVFQSFRVFQFFFEANVAARYVVWAELIQSVVIALLRISLVYFKAPLFLFAVSLLLEPALIALGLWRFYVRTGHRVREWSIDQEMVRGVLRRALPMAIAGIAVVVYMRTDVIMLRYLCDESLVGVYAAAARLCELVGVSAMLLTRALTPALVEGDRMGASVFGKRYQLFLDLIVWVSLVSALVLSVGAVLFIPLFFGEAYTDSVQVLKILAWKGVGVAMGYATAQWILIRSLHDYAPVRNLVGCFANISLNFILIPRFGAVGAATASVISLVLATILVNAVIPALRPVFQFQLRSFSSGPVRLARFRGRCE